MKKHMTAFLIVFLALASTTVYAQRPDTINVEVDYMVGAHSHILNQDEIDMIVQMFACQGIVINIEISDAVPHVTVLAEPWFGTGAEYSFVWYKNNFSDHLGEDGWHYCLMAHQYRTDSGPTSSSGLAEIYGDDFMVTLGSWSGGIGTPFDRAGTFVHELGHNLGLRHAGDQNEGTILQYKPNYPSVMSYRYQVNAVRREMLCTELADITLIDLNNLDYSHGLLPPIDENALIEADGVGYGPVDWNCNGSIDASPISKDLGDYNWCGSSGTKSVLTDYDDWDNMVDVTFARNKRSDLTEEIVSCITREEALAMAQKMADPCDGPFVEVESCVFEYICFDDDGDGFGVPGDTTQNCEWDNCADIFNPDQSDIDGDGLGDACDPDADNDGILNEDDNCPLDSNTAQIDDDGDGYGNKCDNCPADYNAEQYDENGDGIGDACDGLFHIQSYEVPNGYNGVPYFYQFWSVGGVEPVRWSKILGQPPFGTVFNGDTVGTITGTPSWNAEYSMVIVATDSDSPRNTDTISVVIAITDLPYVCGDANGSLDVDIDDVVYLIAYIFSGGPTPDPIESADADCSGAPDIDDVVYLISYIFTGGPPPCAGC